MISNFFVLFEFIGKVFDLFIDVFDFEDVSTTSVVQIEFSKSQILEM